MTARDLWPLLAAAAVVVGLAARDVAVVALGALFLVAWYGARLWSRFSLRRVTYERVLPEDHAFPGERLALRLRVTNGKPLPVPWIEISEQLPRAIAVSGDGASDDDESGGLSPTAHSTQMFVEWRTSLRAHERVSRECELQAAERGAYIIGPATLRSGDPIGLFTSERVEEETRRVVVYPRTVALGDIAIPARRPYGDMCGGERIFEDPSRVAGVRDYQPGDSMRRIDWNATARVGSLQSRVYDPASAHHLLVCLNTQTVAPAWAGFVPDALERAVTVAASVARDAYEARYAVGLLSTSAWPGGDRSVRIPPARRPEQFVRILEALAVTGAFVAESLAAMLDREEHRLPQGATLVVVSAVMPEELAGALLRLARRRYAVVVLKTWDEAWDDEAAGALDVRDVTYVVDERWSKPGEVAR